MTSIEEMPSSDPIANNDSNSISVSSTESPPIESTPSNETTSNNEVNQPLTGISKKRKAEGEYFDTFFSHSLDLIF